MQINASYKPAYVYGGPTMSVSMLCESLIKAGLSIMVFTTTANGNGELSVKPNQITDIDGISVIYFKRITKDHSHLSPSLLLMLWKDVKKFDIIHIHAWWNLVSVLSCFIAIMRNVPVVLSPRGTLSSYSFSNKNKKIKAAIHNLLGRPLLKKCHIHVTSPKEHDAILTLIQPKSITTIPNFVKLPLYKVIKERDVSTPLKLIFFSRIEEKKGLDILINSLAMISAPYKLTIAGNGDQAYIDQLKKLAENNNIEDNITWIGFQDGNKFDLLQQHDLFILPSHDENFGNAVIESLSAGTAVLISEHVGLAEYVVKNNFGWICQTTPSSVSQLIGTINKDYRSDLKLIRQSAPSRVHKDFGGDELTQQYLNMYNKIIKNE